MMGTGRRILLREDEARLGRGSRCEGGAQRNVPPVAVEIEMQATSGLGNWSTKKVRQELPTVRKELQERKKARYM